jgi:dihydroxyacid dehydratase/phosphogluconate dehydratase
MRRAQWTALGLTPQDMEKPKIAIVNSSSGLASCFRHLDGIVGPLRDAIRAAGGIAFEVRTAAPSDAITSAGQAGQYILPSRDLVASDIEVAVEAGCDVDVYALFEELAPRVPLLTAVKPNGGRRIDEFEAAGGALGLMHQLRPILDTAQRTVACVTLGEAIGAVTAVDGR